MFHEWSCIIICCIQAFLFEQASPFGKYVYLSYQITIPLIDLFNIRDNFCELKNMLKNILNLHAYQQW